MRGGHRRRADLRRAGGDVARRGASRHRRRRSLRSLPSSRDGRTDGGRHDGLDAGARGRESNRRKSRLLDDQRRARQGAPVRRLRAGRDRSAALVQGRRRSGARRSDPPSGRRRPSSADRRRPCRWATSATTGIGPRRRLLIKALAPEVAALDLPASERGRVLAFAASNEHLFLNVGMAACKAALDAAHGVPDSTIVTAMARNGTDFGIRVSGLGDRWFTGPAQTPQGLYFPGFSAGDANPDIGDSAITETAGLGGFAMGGAPAVVQFVGGTPADALEYTRLMYEITLGESSAYRLPALDFRGTPTGIDVRLVVQTGILPQIDTGMAHREPGSGRSGPASSSRRGSASTGPSKRSSSHARPPPRPRAGPEPMTTRSIGARIRRNEDPRLLQGLGCFVDDVNPPGVLHAASLRSPHAHARIARIDATAARRVPGVRLVLTAADLGELNQPAPLLIPHPTLTHGRTQRPLAADEVRYVGEVVAFVVADEPLHRRGRAGAHRGALRAAPGRDGAGDRAGARKAARARRRAGQPGRPLPPDRRRRGGRARRRPSCRARAAHDRAELREPDRGPRRGGRVGCPAASSRDMGFDAGAAAHQERPRRPLRLARVQRGGGGARRRRRLRHEDHALLPGRDPRPARGHHARPPGEVDGGPPRAPHRGQPGARPDPRRRGRVRRRGSDPGAARSLRPRHRRLYAVRHRRPDHHLDPAPRALSSAELYRRVRGGLHQQGGGVPVSRRRPPARRLRDGAHDRGDRARARARAGGGAAPQLRPARRVPVGRRAHLPGRRARRATTAGIIRPGSRWRSR